MTVAADAGSGPPLIGQRRLLGIIWVLLGRLLAAADQTIAATALPTIARDLHDLSHLSWVVTGAVAELAHPRGTRAVASPHTLGKSVRPGERTGVWIIRAPLLANASLNAVVNLPSRARITKLKPPARSPRR